MSSSGGEGGGGVRPQVHVCLPVGARYLSALDRVLGDLEDGDDGVFHARVDHLVPLVGLV